MNEINIKVPDGYTVDEKNSSFTCIKFKKKEKKEVTCWEDLQEIKSIDKHTPEDHSKNTFTTKEQAEACIALTMLSQLMKDVNEGWIPDYEDSNRKYVIRFSKNKLNAEWFCNTHYFLCFPTEEIRDTFLQNHKELIMKAKPLL